MSPSNASITYISEPVSVDMADKWYEFSKPDHFWVKRRFEVMHKLIRSWIDCKNTWLDVGCGSGILQNYCNITYGLNVVGADLNLVALQLNKSGAEHTLCYDINSRQAGMQGKFEVVSAMDVIEHVDNECQFIESLLYHLRTDGRLLINVPAIQCLYSNYDKEAGHKRRYNAKDVWRLAQLHNLSVESWSYWGFSLIPVLIARNTATYFSDQDKIIERGFSPSNKLIDRILAFLGRLEILPNHLIGTSLMMVLRKKEAANSKL